MSGGAGLSSVVAAKADPGTRGAHRSSLAGFDARKIDDPSIRDAMTSKYLAARIFQDYPPSPRVCRPSSSVCTPQGINADADRHRQDRLRRRLRPDRRHPGRLPRRRCGVAVAAAGMSADSRGPGHGQGAREDADASSAPSCCWRGPAAATTGGTAGTPPSRWSRPRKCRRRHAAWSRSSRSSSTWPTRAGTRFVRATVQLVVGDALQATEMAETPVLVMQARAIILELLTTQTGRHAGHARGQGGAAQGDRRARGRRPCTKSRWSMSSSPTSSSSSEPPTHGRGARADARRARAPVDFILGTGRITVRECLRLGRAQRRPARAVGRRRPRACASTACRSRQGEVVDRRRQRGAAHHRASRRRPAWDAE